MRTGTSALVALTFTTALLSAPSSAVATPRCDTQPM
ncbi:hypothetical protein SSPIM334S_06026 [Streptomyces spiroverticillatus]